MQCSGLGVSGEGSGFRMWGAGFGVWGLKCMVQGAGHGV